MLTVNEDITVGEGAQTDLTMDGSGAALTSSIPLLTNYWAGVSGDRQVQLALSKANALAGTFIDVTGAGAGGGRYNFGGPAGWATDAVAAASKTDGYGSIAVTAGNEISFAAPERMTLVGMAAADACSYWWGR